MRDTANQCECCGKREQVGQCVKGKVMCSCETNNDWLVPTALLCPDCSKCPIHCKCYGSMCGCRPFSWQIELGHDTRKCPIPDISRANIRYHNAKEKLEKAERLRKATFEKYGVQIK